MLRTVIPRSILTLSSKHLASASATRAFSQSAIRFAKDPKMHSGPPKHEMAYFPQMNSSLPSTSSDFRRVVWTGLYSQVVLMTVPVGGDVGDEVRSCLFNAGFNRLSVTVPGLTAVSPRLTSSTKSCPSPQDSAKPPLRVKIRMSKLETSW